MNATLYGFLAVLIAREVTWWKRWGIVITAFTFILLITFSRLYLGAHFLSDVLSGLSFGTAAVALVSAALLHFKPETVEIGGLTRAIALTIVLPGGWHIYHRYASDLESYALHPQAICGGSVNPHFLRMKVSHTTSLAS